MRQTPTFLAALLTLCAVKCAAGEEAPLWDLTRDEIPAERREGTFEKVGGAVKLREGAAFAVPAEAFPDQKNFTVQVTLSLDELKQDAVFTVMRKQSEGDDGFGLYFNYRDNPYYARQVNSVVNNILMTGGAMNGRAGPKVGMAHTFTLAVREGLASFYIDDAPIKSCFMEMIPNREAMWIGRNVGATAKAKTMSVTVHDVKVYGAAHRYASKRERPTEFPRGAVAGKGWALEVPKIEHPEWKKVLIYGDSISVGYSGHFIPEMLKRRMYVFHCVHFVGGEVPEAALTEMAGRYAFDAVIFNNGLHSLHWTPDQVSDSLVRERMRKLARCFKTGAPRAKVYYLSTTPHTAARPGPDTPVTTLGEKNAVVLRLNGLSAEVMKEEGIEWIDVYSLLAARLELASGDGYHWQAPALQIISQELAARLTIQ